MEKKLRIRLQNACTIDIALPVPFTRRRRVGWNSRALVAKGEDMEKQTTNKTIVKRQKAHVVSGLYDVWDYMTVCIIQHHTTSYINEDWTKYISRQVNLLYR